METLWFGIVSLMLTVYVVMDGFDFGAGAIHLFVGKNDGERRLVLAAIGPLWDGNEVWLVAAGGALFVAFPKVLAVGFSGFYLALMLVLWTLILRGISIEFRSHVNEPLWRSFWDAVFALSSSLMPILLGAALGNVIRGVPLSGEGYFELPLFTDWRASHPPGLLDWYTMLVAIFALLVLSGHGALFVAWKTDGPVQERSRALAAWQWVVVPVFSVALALSTSRVNPAIFAAWATRPLAWIASAASLAGLALVFWGNKRGRDLVAFLGSCAFIGGALASLATCLYPTMLQATRGHGLDLTAHNASASVHGLKSGLLWWCIGLPLVVLYFGYLFRIHRGKVTSPNEGEGY